MIANVAGRAGYYETRLAVAHFTDRYNRAKEGAFCRRIASLIPSGARVLEIGGGPGFHGALLSRGLSYTHSDCSGAMVEAARERGLRSLRLDALDPAAFPECDAVVAIELSTLRSERISERRVQIEALAKALRPGTRLILSTASAPWRCFGHAIDAGDLAAFEASGFRVERQLAWGVLPRTAWDLLGSHVASASEQLLSALGIGVRKITVLTR